MRQATRCSSRSMRALADNGCMRSPARAAHRNPARRAGMRAVTAVSLAALALGVAGSVRAQSPAASDWGYYGGDMFGQRYSSLDQINRGNVTRLAVAWIYRSGEL